MTTSRQMRLLTHPPGTLPIPGEVALEEVPVPEPGPGQVLVRNLYMAIDPGLLLRMRCLDGLVPDFPLGEVMWGHALGEVVASADPGKRPGDVVLHRLAWREYALADAAKFDVVDADLYPSRSHHLSSAVVAWVGLSRIRIAPGDTVVVSSAAGAVGSVAGQLAKLRGAGRVIGSVGSPDKAGRVVRTLGFDDAFDYHEGWPDLGGVDVYYDNVGGQQLEAAIEAMNPHGRIVLCGGTEQQVSGQPHGIRNMQLVIAKRLTLQGFTTDDHPDVIAEFTREFPPLVARGAVVLPETVIDGLENIIPAMRAQLEGAHFGKVLLRFRPDGRPAPATPRS
ncbi:NADP-dependent oxidoreductase [Amycolatopsis sp. A133]|uniref:NADP-dependent oxidoreductase n=1 Tax=Amycolatopsis sp. A133 TaxID=3064472 RepID=UPI0027ED60C9|nr:NADP-dependent oxidoreductase [Amycolatopsis sp. A133]MDQ7810293.1 NADP-dependent oxidoreductase [Amycolatopsis sp. A133]